MNTEKLWCLLVVALLVVLLAIPTSILATESSPDMIESLVSFYQTPGHDEMELIEGLGGSIKVINRLIPVILATVPSANLDELGAGLRVKSIEPDIMIPNGITGEVLPWGIDRVEAELVHPSNKGTGVKIAILDTGIDLDHPDLNVAGNVTFVPETTSGDDDNGHGTLVAGIVAALDNDIGTIGVAPEAELYAVKVLNRNGDGVMSLILSGIEWAVDNNMDIINMSFGGAMNWPSTVREALDNAYNAGIVIVAGAGNGGTTGGEGENIWAPARYNSVIAVGATDELDNRYSVSSTGDTLELMAPGVNIYSTAMGGGYSTISRTSASSPHVAGVAALLIASGIDGNVDVRQTLRDMAKDLGDPGWDTQYGWGLVNARDVGSLIEPSDDIPPDLNIPDETQDDNAPIPDVPDETQDDDAPVPNSPDESQDNDAVSSNTSDEGDVQMPPAMPEITLTSSKDSFLRRDYKNINEGANPFMVVEKTGRKRTVAAFDISGVPTANFKKATLVLTIAEPAKDWGKNGRLVNAYRLNEHWTEGNGFNWGQKKKSRIRSGGPGVTWNCPTDTDISNRKPDCDSKWKGGELAAEPATAPGVRHTDEMTGEVSWDVTADVLAAFDESTAEVSWLIKNEKKGKVIYYSKEGAVEEGNPSLAPRLILEY